MSIFPPGGSLPPPPVPDAAGLQGLIGAGAPPNPGDVARDQMMMKLRPVIALVGELTNFLLDNPDIAPIAKTIINSAFGATKGLKAKRERGLDTPEAVAEGPPPLPEPGGMGPMPMVPPMGGPMPGFPMAPAMRNRTSIL